MQVVTFVKSAVLWYDGSTLLENESPDMRRILLARWLLIGAILAALFWLGAVFAFVKTPTAGRLRLGDAVVRNAPVPAIRPDLAGAIGVNLGPAELSSPELEGSLARLDENRIIWVRFRLPWDQIELRQGQFDWRMWDTVFGVLAQHPHLQPLVVLDGSPTWARSAADAANPLAPPHERADFGAFAAAVALRYGGQVRYYQIWQEPNIAPHWGARPADPADYLGLLREGAARIRAADADALIVLAGLAPTTETGGANLSDISFLDQIYAHGGRAWFDIAAAQPYGFSQPPDAAPGAGALNFGRAALLRQVMERHGDAATALWATSFGWSSAQGGAPAAAGWGQVGPEEQARYLGAALELARTGWPWLGPLFWAADCAAPAAADPFAGFALCAADGGPRPAWQALVSLAKAPPFLPPGDHAADHPALRYGPGWRVSPAGADPSHDGDALSFDFYGTGLALRIQGGPYWALYRITVDGRPANALPRDETGQAYLVLHDPEAARRVVPVAVGLAAGRHQATLQASGGWGQWALQGVIVSDRPAGLPAWIWQALALGGLLAGLACVLLARPWWRPAAARLQTAFTWAAGWPAALQWGLAIVFALVLAFSRWLAVDLAALAGLALLFAVRPDLSLPLIAFAIPLWPHPKPLLHWSFTHYELFLWLGMLGYLVSPFTDRRARRLRGLDWPVLALLLAGLVSSLAAERRAVALHEWRAVFLLGAVYYWLISRVPARTRAGRFSPWPLVDGLLLGMVFVSLLGFWQLASGQGRIAVEGVWRVRALYGSPNNLALVLDRVIPLALAVALFGPGLLRRWLYGLGALIIAAACIATFSKGALLLGLPAGIGLVLVAGAFRLRNRWPVWVLGAGGFSGLLLLAFLFRTPRFADLLNFQSGTSFIRLNLWQSAWRMALDHPWLGVGPDNFLYAYRSHYVLPAAWQELNLSHPHNILLDLWTRLGLLGVIAGAWAVGAGARLAWRLYRSAGSDTWPLALGLLAGLVVAVVHGMIDNSLFLIDLMALFLMSLALLRRFSCES